jgi:hypothetical protein
MRMDGSFFPIVDGDAATTDVSCVEWMVLVKAVVNMIVVVVF